MLADDFAWNGDNLSFPSFHIHIVTTAYEYKLSYSSELTSSKIYRKTRKKFVRTKADTGLAYNTWNGKNNDKLIPAKPKWKYVVGIVEGVTTIVMERNWKM
ncbi:unnamed protein product [Rhizophagus irregularis]|nr:unnamed protein product [Rhizophagus irregularis]